MDERKFPRIMLWAWERPENLEFIDPKRFGVAFLAQTLVLDGNQVVYSPRRQPLNVPPNTMLMAVTRIESQNVTGRPAALTPGQSDSVVDLIVKTIELKNVAAIQIDFDATQSERVFYRTVLENLRRRLPDNMPLSMTALASFCLGDRWLHELPIDEAVPMIFRMGADDRAIKEHLANGGDLKESLCRRSYGVAVDEPLTMKFDNSRRLYVFNYRSWTEKDWTAFADRTLR